MLLPLTAFFLPPSPISTTLMSMLTLNILPRQLTVVPSNTAHVQMGKASVSLPIHAGSHSIKVGCLAPPLRAVPRANDGVFSSTSTLRSS